MLCTKRLLVLATILFLRLCQANLKISKKRELPIPVPPLLYANCTFKNFCGLTQPLSLSVTQSAFASTSDRPLCFPRACVGLIGPRPSDYPHALSACYYFLPAVFLLALGLWSSLPARQLSLDTSYSFLIFSVFFFFFFF